MNTVAVVQARMGSSRLPGKVLADVGGRALLARVVERARRARLLDEVAVATTTSSADDAIAQWCAAASVRCFRGSEEDVLDRYVLAARQSRADIIVRLTADCPLLDPGVIDQVITAFFEQPCDYAANVVEPTWPDGLDTEVFSRAVLERAASEAVLPADREHVTTYIRTHPQRFRLRSVRGAEDLSSLRWTVDEPRDLDLVRAVYDLLGDRPFGMHDVLALYQTRPELERLNAGIIRNEGYSRSLERERGQHPRGRSV